MEINRKARRSGATAAQKAKRPEAERAGKGAAKKAVRAADKVDRTQDRLERRLRDELEGSGVGVRDIVGRLLGQERTPAVERMVARLQTAQRVESTGPYGP